MRLNFWLLALHNKAYWLGCLIFAAHYADWKRTPASVLAASPKGRAANANRRLRSRV